jgi:hypothetical protein
MINESEIKKLDVYFTGKYLIDEEKDLELKKILSELIEERQKFKQMVKETHNDMELGKQVRTYFINQGIYSKNV